MSDKKEKAFGSRFKMIYSLVQIVLFYLLVSLFPNYDLLFILIMAIVYLIPFYINSYFIKFTDRDKKLSKYIVEDTVFYYLPSVAISLVLEIVLYFAGLINGLLCFYTVVLFIIFTLLTSFQCLKCFLQYRIKNAMKKTDGDERK